MERIDDWRNSRCGRIGGSGGDVNSVEGQGRRYGAVAV